MFFLVAARILSLEPAAILRISVSLSTALILIAHRLMDGGESHIRITLPDLRILMCKQHIQKKGA